MNRDNYEIYNSKEIYSSKTISKLPVSKAANYAEAQLIIKFNILKDYLHKDSTLLDLGCSNGSHLIHLADSIKEGIGIDFSRQFIEYAKEQALQHNKSNLNFIECDFKSLPIESQSIDCLFSFGSLYNIQKNLEEILSEISRVVKKDGIAILDLGNSRSLVKIVSNHTQNAAALSPYTIEQFLSILKNDFQIINHRCFQLHPMWGSNPLIVRLLNIKPILKLMQVKISGKMIDEWISSLPILRRYAFRHIVTFKKK